MGHAPAPAGGAHPALAAPRQVIGVDWSGARDPARVRSAVWTATVAGGRLVELRCGRDRDEVVDALVEACLVEPETLIGLDFAFSLPGWLLDALGLGGAGEAWRWAARWEDAGADLSGLPAPFWGPGVRPRPAGVAARPARVTEAELAAPGARPLSPVQVSGAGSVGAQSLFGMPRLMLLADAGIAVWPFDPPRLPMAAEVFPRLLARRLAPDLGALRGEAFRRAVVARLPPAAVGGYRDVLDASHDAFDAAVTAWALWTAAAPAGLPLPPPHAAERREGRILAPHPPPLPAPA